MNNRRSDRSDCPNERLAEIIIDTINSDKRFNRMFIAKYDPLSFNKLFINVYRLSFIARWFRFYWLDMNVRGFLWYTDCVGYLFVKRDAILFYHYKNRTELVVSFDGFDLDEAILFFTDNKNGKQSDKHSLFIKVFMGEL